MIFRKFGVELEVLGDRELAFEALQKLDRRSEDFRSDHRKRSYWKIVDDYSVFGNRSCGFEVVSPILSGEAGIANVLSVVSALKEVGCTVNKSCGFHVHVDARDLHPRSILNVLERYGRFEPRIDKTISVGRRFNRSEFCRSVADLDTSRLRKAIDVPSRFKYRAGGLDRQRKVNLCAYRDHGSIEFRQREGTLDYHEVANWIRFCVQFVEASKIPLYKHQQLYETIANGPTKLADIQRIFPTWTIATVRQQVSRVCAIAGCEIYEEDDRFVMYKRSQHKPWRAPRTGLWSGIESRVYRFMKALEQ